jgi:hypothetical protein
MSERTLWDFVEAGGSREEYVQSADREESRRHAIKRLRASGHWLTLLRVARSIPQPFTLNDISVAVWRACPDFFGMKGYPYPDNHKVHYILYGSRGLIARGVIERVREGLFRVATGVDVEAVLAPGPEEQPAGPPGAG